MFKLNTIKYGEELKETMSISLFFFVEGEIRSVHIEKLNYSVSIGESVTLQCTVTSSLTVTSVYWYTIVYGKIKILNSTSSGINESSISNPSLTIINAALCDQGHYTCLATNILGVVQSANTSLSINGSTISKS